jgi:hypothetical protein
MRIVVCGEGAALRFLLHWLILRVTISENELAHFLIKVYPQTFTYATVPKLPTITFDSVTIDST